MVFLSTNGQYKLQNSVWIFHHLPPPFLHFFALWQHFFLCVDLPPLASKPSLSAQPPLLSLVHPYFSVSQWPTLLCPLETCKGVIIWFSNSSTIIITTELESQNAELGFHWTIKQEKNASSKRPSSPRSWSGKASESILSVAWVPTACWLSFPMLPPQNCDLTWTTLLYSITLGSSWNWNSVHPCELHIWAFWNSYILTCKWASVLQSWAMKGLEFLHIYSPVQSSILSVIRNHLQQGGVRFPLVVPNLNKSSLYPLCVPQTLFPKEPPSHTLWLQPSDQNASPCLYTEGSILSHQPLTPEDCEDYNYKFHCSWLETCSIDVYICAS